MNAQTREIFKSKADELRKRQEEVIEARKAIDSYRYLISRAEQKEINARAQRLTMRKEIGNLLKEITGQRFNPQETHVMTELTIADLNGHGVHISEMDCGGYAYSGINQTLCNLRKRGFVTSDYNGYYTLTNNL